MVHGWMVIILVREFGESGVGKSEMNLFLIYIYAKHCEICFYLRLKLFWLSRRDLKNVEPEARMSL